MVIQALKYTVLTLAAMLCSGGVCAASWKLDPAQSTLNFISIKNTGVAETHRFTELSGSIGEQGEVNVAIALASVDTLIQIRDQRMRELLFNTATFPQATLTAAVEADVLKALAEGETVSMEVPVTLALHGEEKSLRVPVVASRQDDSLRVLSARPVVVNAADFGLTGGIAALQKIAGLQSIATAVPVTINLVFALDS